MIRDNLELEGQFIELRLQGLSFDAISAKLGINKEDLVELLVNTECAEYLNMARFFRLETLADKYHMLKNDRIESLGKLLNKVDTALDNVEFYDKAAEAEKLLDMKLKLTDRLKAEISETFTIDKGIFGEGHDTYFEISID